MKRNQKAGIVLALACVASSGTVQADLWGIDSSIGVMPAVMSYRSMEPEGDTARETVVYPLTLSATFNINRINRIVTDFRYVDFDVAAGNGGIGVTVEGYQLTTALQHHFRLSRHFRPWVGGGIVSSMIDTTDRFRTDSDGFLVERFDDREETTMSGVAMVGMDWDLTRDWRLAAEARYERPFSDGLEGYGVAAGIRYHF